MNEKNRNTDLIRVVIVEDNQYIREGWTTILDSDSNIVVKNVFRSCEQAFESKDIEYCDIMLLDIQLPGMQGTEAVGKFLEVNPGLAVIMISVMEDSQHIFEALQNGAIGYLIKKVGPDELIQAVKDAYEGGSPMSPIIARKVIASMQSQSKNSSEKLALTDREKDVLRLLAEGNSYQSIAEEIYLSVDGVGYHIRNIYRKLQVNSKAEAVAKGISAGLIQMADS